MGEKMSQPANLPHVGTANWMTNTYDWRPIPSLDTATHYTYAMYDYINSVFASYAGTQIQVEKSTNTWSDYDTVNHPNNVVDNGTTVTFDYSGAAYEFTKPPPWWSSNPPPPGTLSVASPQGSVGRTGQSIAVVINKNSPSSSGSVSYVIQKDGISQGPGISHTQNTTTDFVQNLPFAVGIWRLWYQESGGGDQLLDIFAASEGRKRHATFW